MKRIKLAKLTHKGFGHVELFIAIIVVASIAFIGLRVMEAGHAQTACTPSTNYVNPCRAWVGAAVGNIPGAGKGGISQFNYLETSILGKQLDIYRSYHSVPSNDNCPSGQDCATGFSAPPVNAEERYFAAHGKALDINWSPAKTYKDAESVADGGSPYINANIVSAAKSIKALAPTKVFLSPWHETNLGASSDAPGCVVSSRHGYGEPADFIKAWQNMHNVFQQEHVTNVIWTLNYASYKARDCQVPLLWPGSQYVDWVIYDTYDHNWPAEGTSFATTAGNFYAYLKSLSSSTDKATATIGKQINSKPWGLGEFGTCLDTNVANSRQYYLDAANDYKNNVYPNLKMYLVFDNSGAPAAGGGTGGDSCLTNYDSNGAKDPTKQADFNKLVDDILGAVGVQHVSPPTINSFTAAPASVVAGSTATLSWSITNSKTCSVAPGGPSNSTLTSWTTAKLTSVGTTTYTLTCQNAGGSTNKSVSISVTPPGPTVSIASPTNGSTVQGIVVIKVDASSNVTHARLVWDSTNVIRDTTQENAYGWGSQWGTGQFPNGLHTVTVTVWDAKGDSKSASVKVDVLNHASVNSNVPPSQ